MNSMFWPPLKDARRIVIKIGSNLLTSSNGTLRHDWLLKRCQEIVQVMRAEQRRQMIIVTSGAISLGTPKLNLNRRPRKLREKQAAAAAGQTVLMRGYEQAFAEFNMPVAQVLLTRDDVQNRRRYLNARNTLDTLLNLGLMPVVNENDTVVTAEIRHFGDNDTLAAGVACLVDADLLILLSDVDGLYSADPRHDVGAKKLSFVDRVTPEIEQMAGGIGSAVGTGGMITKLRAAKQAARCGCGMVLVNGFTEGVISQIFSGERIGTFFAAEVSPLASRKRWIVNGLAARGKVMLDQGAVDALESGKSLLARGVTFVEDQFDRGDAVLCCDPGGRIMAKGLSNYSAKDLRKIQGHNSWEFESILGYIDDEEIIHRDDLVLL
ncbi:glutamate 5-kinase [Magnetococcales bacterium HHB-1]